MVLKLISVSMDFTTVIGVTASAATSLSSLPQLIKLIKEKKAENVSHAMFAVLVVGMAFWVWYGILRKDWIIIIANSVSFLINLATIISSLKYKKNT